MPELCVEQQSSWSQDCVVNAAVNGLKLSLVSASSWSEHLCQDHVWNGQRQDKWQKFMDNMHLASVHELPLP